MENIFGALALPTLAVVGETNRYEVRRIFCVGRNYAEHAAEMGNTVDTSAPFYFTKSAFALATEVDEIPYAPKTSDFHHEMEFVIAIGGTGFEINPVDAMDLVYGYACGLDMTRRDLQWESKEKRRPWDTSKDFEMSAVIAPITKSADFGNVGPQRIQLTVNGQTRQNSTLDMMIHSVPKIIADLSTYYHLAPGDIIMTGTPAGVGAVVSGDVLHGTIDGLTPLTVKIG